MKITESKLRQIIREELIRETIRVNGKEHKLYRWLDEDAQDLAEKLTKRVHGPEHNLSNRTRVDWKLEEMPYTNSGKHFTHFKVSLMNVHGPDVEWTMIGKGKTQRKALEDALASRVLLRRPFSE